MALMCLALTCLEMHPKKHKKKTLLDCFPPPNLRYETTSRIWKAPEQQFRSALPHCRTCVYNFNVKLVIAPEIILQTIRGSFKYLACIDGRLDQVVFGLSLVRSQVGHGQAIQLGG